MKNLLNKIGSFLSLWSPLFILVVLLMIGAVEILKGSHKKTISELRYENIAQIDETLTNIELAETFIVAEKQSLITIRNDLVKQYNEDAAKAGLKCRIEERK